MAASSPSNTPFFYHHVPKNILLILLSWICLPLTTTITLISLIITHLNPPSKPSPIQNDSTRKTILVTGTSMTKGLAIARLLSLHTPHRIIAADTEPILFTSPGRYSSSISRFHRLASPNGEDAEPYIESLLSVIRRESVHLWISCSSVVGEVEDGEVMKQATQERGAQNFHAVQFSAQHVERLHEKDQFTTYIASLGLPTPESHRCTSASEAERFLATTQKEGGGKGKQFIMKPIGVDDRARAAMMTLLPLSSPQKTITHLASLRISEKNPYLLQQYISGPEYCTHALVIGGRVKAFTACPSLELLMHYEALAPESPLFRKMLEFTRRVARDAGREFTGHLSFDFLAEREGDDVELFPIECNPRAHTAVVLFRDTPEMAGAYLNIFNDDEEEEEEEGDEEKIVVPRTPTVGYYWVGHDLVTFLLIPLLSLVFGNGSIGALVEGLRELLHHLIYWCDGTYAVSDPIPFWVLYHIYWPAQFIRSLVMDRRWSRINVSTTKMFLE